MADKLVIKKFSEFLKVTDPTGCTFAGYKTGQGDIQIDFSSMTPLFGVSQTIGTSTTNAPSENAVNQALQNKADKAYLTSYAKTTTAEGTVVRTADGIMPYSLISYSGTPENTRLQIVSSKRKKSLIISYNNGKEQTTEQYLSDNITDAYWQNSTYWKRIDVNEEFFYRPAGKNLYNGSISNIQCNTTVGSQLTYQEGLFSTGKIFIPLWVNGIRIVSSLTTAVNAIIVDKSGKVLLKQIITHTGTSINNIRNLTNEESYLVIQIANFANWQTLKDSLFIFPYSAIRYCDKSVIYPLDTAYEAYIKGDLQYHYIKDKLVYDLTAIEKANAAKYSLRAPIGKNLINTVDRYYGTFLSTSTTYQQFSLSKLSLYDNVTQNQSAMLIPIPIGKTNLAISGSALKKYVFNFIFTSRETLSSTLNTYSLGGANVDLRASEATTATITIPTGTQQIAICVGGNVGGTSVTMDWRDIIGEGALQVEYGTEVTAWEAPVYSVREWDNMKYFHPSLVNTDTRKVIGIVGDSIADGYGMTGEAKDLPNGTKYSLRLQAEGRYNIFNAATAGGSYRSRTGGTISGKSFRERWAILKTMLTNANVTPDLIFIPLGTNDRGAYDDYVVPDTWNYPLNGKTAQQIVAESLAKDKSALDLNLLHDAFRDTIELVRTDYPTTVIAVWIPLQDLNNLTPDKLPYPYMAYKVISLMAQYYGVPIVDAYRESSISGFIERPKLTALDPNRLLSDGLHPSAKGHIVLANFIGGYFNKLLSK